MAAAPAASTSASALTPGSGSASRAAPIGISGDAATATPAATTAPMAAATPTLISPAAISCQRVRPSAASAGVSGELVGEQPGGRLADDQQRGDRQHQREQGERGRLGPDSTLHGRGLRALISDECATASGGKPARQ